MSNETTTASNETTAPVDQVVQQETQNEVAEAPVGAPEASAEPDYSYVPKKFLNEGKPDFENLVKSYQNLEKKLGQKGALPPSDIAEYEWSGDAPVPIDDNSLNAFKADAQKANLSKEQYAFVMDKYSELMTAHGFNPEASSHALKKVWGDEYVQNITLARRAFEEFAPSDVSLEDPVLNNPTVIRLLARLGQEMGEDTQSNVKGSPTRSGQTQEDIQKLMNEPDYWNNREKQQVVAAWYEKNRR